MKEHTQVKQANPKLWAAVILVLTMVEKDGAHYQRADLSDEETVGLYVKDCAAMQLTHEMVWSARDDVRHRRDYKGEMAPFPRPYEFAVCVAEHVHESWPVISLVVGEDSGVPIVSNRHVSPVSAEWREHVAALKRAHESTAPELPSQESRDRANALAESIDDFPVKRIRPARERAKFVDVEDPEATERRDRMLAQVRTG